MLYIYAGPDIERARAKLRATVGSLRAKYPQALFIRFTTEDIEKINFLELTESQALFKSNYVVVFDNLLAELPETIDFIKEFKDSDNLFFILEDELDRKYQEKFTKIADKVTIFNKKQEPKKPTSPNLFRITDAILEKRFLDAWIELQKAENIGVSSEEIVGILFWLFKSVKVVFESQNPNGTGINPFVFNKIKKNITSKKWQKNSVDKYLVELSQLTQQARLNNQNTDILLEKFILKDC